MIKRAEKEVKALSWHPDFRDRETLPDISMVRTRVFVPLFFMVIALVFAGLILMREYNSMGVKENIAQLESEIQSNSGQRKELQKLNGQFLALSRKMDEVLAFRNGQLVASDFVLDLAALIPEKMLLSRVSYQADKAMISGVVAANAEDATLIINKFLLSLEESGIVQEQFDHFQLTSLDRAKEGENISFRIEIADSSKKSK